MNTTQKVQKSVRGKPVGAEKPSLVEISPASADNDITKIGKDTLISKATELMFEFLWKFFAPLMIFILNWCQLNLQSILLTVAIILLTGILMTLLFIAISSAKK